MPLALPVVAVGLFALIFALVATIIVTPYIEAAAAEIPVVGGYIGRVVGRLVDRGTGRLKRYAATFVAAVVGWLLGLGDSAKRLAEAAALFAVTIVQRLDHLTHVTVHEIVHAFVNPIRDLARSAQDDANALAGSLGLVYTEALEDFRGIEHGVDLKIDHLRDLVQNVDLPRLGAQLGDVIGQVERDAVGRVGHLRDEVVPDLHRVVDKVNGLPIGYLLDAAAAATATGVLVDLLSRETGLNRAECRAKVKGICGVDPLAWTDLLTGLLPLALAPTLDDLVETAQYLAETLGAEIVDVAG